MVQPRYRTGPSGRPGQLPRSIPQGVGKGIEGFHRNQRNPLESIGFHEYPWVHLTPWPAGEFSKCRKYVILMDFHREMRKISSPYSHPFRRGLPQNSPPPTRFWRVCGSTPPWQKLSPFLAFWGMRVFDPLQPANPRNHPISRHKVALLGSEL